jgi:hypothetical protein
MRHRHGLSPGSKSARHPFTRLNLQFNIDKRPGTVSHPSAPLAKGAGFDFALPVSPNRPTEGNLSEMNSRLQGASLKAAAT